MKKLFIGIDFSKKTMDVSFFDKEDMHKVHYGQFENTKKDFDRLLKWIRSVSDVKTDQWLFCGEHTGLYSIELSEFLVKKGLFIWLENPLQIKRSAGIKREKSDKVDSRAIALYAYRFQDKARCWHLPQKSFKDLGLLLGFRERLIKNKVSLEVSCKELRRVYRRDTTARFIYEQSQSDIARIKKEIKVIEKKMTEMVKSSPELKENYDLATSVKGIGKINALTILIISHNFTTFQNSRQFSCYGGMAPFKNSSGTSLNKGSHVSYLANRQVKALLTQAARAAVEHDELFGEYYNRKIEQGKHPHIALNNVRNKLLHTLFAVVRNKTPYQQDYGIHVGN